MGWGIPNQQLSTQKGVQEVSGCPLEVTAIIFNATNQVVHAVIKKKEYSDWIFSAVYGSPNPPVREAFFRDIREIASSTQALLQTAEEPVNSKTKKIPADSLILDVRDLDEPGTTAG